MAANKLLKFALNYAEHGIAVFPVVPNGKRPLTEHGCHDATTDPDTIRDWWRRTPNANIGVATGIEHGLIVIDVDIDRNTGKYGDETLRYLEEKYGQLPDSWQVLTPSGGSHNYFKAPAGIDIANSASTIGKNIDVRGAGGYVVAPPSSVNGRFYTWEASSIPKETELAELPTAWVKLIQGTPKESKEQTTKGKKNSAKFEAPEIIGEGSRNATLFKWAASDRARGYQEEEILAHLVATNALRCDPPLPEEELHTIVRSVCEKYPAGEPITFAAINSPTNSENTAGRKDAPPMPNTDELRGFFTTLDTVKPQERTWLIPNRIAKGEMTVISADGGSGKSSITLDLVHSIISGETSFLDYNAHNPRRPIGDVLLLSVEDSLACDIVPQLMAMGATPEQLTRVHTMNADTMPPTIRAHMVFGDPIFEMSVSMIQEENPLDLIVIDPLQSFLGDDVNMISRNSMRKALDSITEIARKHDTAVIVLSHTNKRGNGSSGRNRVSDSSDLWDDARALYMAGETATKGEFYFSLEKGNHIRRTQAPTILYRFETTYAVTEDGKQIETKQVVPFAVTDKSDSEFISEKQGHQRVEKQTIATSCEEKIVEILLTNGVEHNGIVTMRTSDLDKVLDLSYSTITIKRAKANLAQQHRIKTRTTGFKPKIYYTDLIPETNPFDPGEKSEPVPMQTTIESI